MKLLKSFISAFAVYSRIPMPMIELSSEDMEYSFIFFPFVGLVCAVSFVAAIVLGKKYLELPDTAIAFVCTALNLLITGGFHLDGYMDTTDALSSYGDKQKRLEILKDPHIGAFAVIGVLKYYFLYLAALIYIVGQKDLNIYDLTAIALGFVYSRIFSSFGALYLKKVKNEGMLKTESDAAKKKNVVAVGLAIEFLLATIFILLKCSPGMIIVPLAVIGNFFYYRHKCYKEFGGITGDTAGWFVVVSELIVVLLVIFVLFLRSLTGIMISF